MRTMGAHISTFIRLGILLGLICTIPAWGAPPSPPKEKLAGLTPGRSTLKDAVRIHGAFDIKVPGFAEGYAGGLSASTACQWNAGQTMGRPVLTVEGPLGSKAIDLVMVDMYPGLPTSRGLTTLVPHTEAVKRYGLPDYAFEVTFGDNSIIELYYLEHGLMVVVNQVEGQPDLMITKIILTYPGFLRNAVSVRVRNALRGTYVKDITRLYGGWARSAIDSE